MSGMWMIGYVVLWLLVMGLGMAVLALAREVEMLHTRLESLYRFLDKVNTGSDGREPHLDMPQITPEEEMETYLKT
jgi:hypothetical protein